MTTGRWERITCPLCPGDLEGNQFLTCGDRLREPGLLNYHLVSCPDCGLIYLNPRPTSERMDEFYQDSGYDPFLSIQTSRGCLDSLYEVARRFTLSWKSRVVKRLISPDAHILDVGCSTGEFLAALKTDFKVEGIEPEPKAARWARERFGLKVHTGSPDNVELPVGRFDLVTMWHVLEHVPQPLETLKLLTETLTGGGKMLIALPNIQSLDARIYKSCWVAIDAPRHFWHFSTSQLKRLASKAGLKLVSAGMLPLDTFYNVLHSELLCKQVRGSSQILISPFRISITLPASLIFGFLSGQHSGKLHLFEKC